LFKLYNILSTVQEEPEIETILNIPSKFNF